MRNEAGKQQVVLGPIPYDITNRDGLLRRSLDFLQCFAHRLSPVLFGRYTTTHSHHSTDAFAASKGTNNMAKRMCTIQRIQYCPNGSLSPIGSPHLLLSRILHSQHGRSSCAKWQRIMSAPANAHAINMDPIIKPTRASIIPHLRRLSRTRFANSFLDSALQNGDSSAAILATSSAEASRAAANESV